MTKQNDYSRSLSEAELRVQRAMMQPIFPTDADRRIALVARRIQWLERLIEVEVEVVKLARQRLLQQQRFYFAQKEKMTKEKRKRKPEENGGTAEPMTKRKDRWLPRKLDLPRSNRPQGRQPKVHRSLPQD